MSGGLRGLGDLETLLSETTNDLDSGGKSLEELKALGAEYLPEALISNIIPSPWQPRKNVTEKRVQDLVPSIEKHGVMQPIVLVPISGMENKPENANGADYMIVAGERRWLASTLAGLTTIPAVVKYGLSDLDIRVWSILENIDREDLSAMEEAIHIVELLNDPNMNVTQDDLAKRFSRSKAWVSKRKKLGMANDKIKEFAASGITSDVETLVSLSELYNLDSRKAEAFLSNPYKLNRESIRESLADIKGGSSQESRKPSEKKAKSKNKPVASKDVNNNPSSAENDSPIIFVRFNSRRFILLPTRAAEPGHVWVKEEGNDDPIHLSCEDGSIVLEGF